jgi:transglutaminase-like putative cysteine protease
LETRSLKIIVSTDTTSIEHTAMRLKIKHRTEYSYDRPLPYALQRLRLSPASGSLQIVRSWSLSIEGAKEEVRFIDHFGNDTRLISVEGEPHAIGIEAAGEVDTVNKAGMAGLQRGFAPLWLFLRHTPLTAPGEAIKALAATAAEGTDLDCLHRLMAEIRERVAYAVGTTDSDTVAEEALSKGSGVCQDHAHIFISAARLNGFPARYVSGYLMVDGVVEQVASHAWAEAYVEALGWVGFDVANGISPDENYVRIATGRDYRDAMPVSGIRLGQASEQLAVRITVEQ